MWTFEIPFDQIRIDPSADHPGPLTRDEAYAIYEADCEADANQAEEEARLDQEYRELNPYELSEEYRYQLRQQLGYWPWSSTLEM